MNGSVDLHIFGSPESAAAGWERRIALIRSLGAYDALSPAAFIGSCWTRSLQPEKQLMFAVLQDAVFCFETYFDSADPLHKRLFTEAEHWLLDDNQEWPFSFSNICLAIELDMDLVRGGLMRWKHRREVDACREETVQGVTAQQHHPVELAL
jgi:hypothetical protein